MRRIILGGYPTPVLYELSVESEAMKDFDPKGFQKQIAKELAKFLIANGFVVPMSTYREHNRDSFRVTIGLYAYKKQMELP